MLYHRFGGTALALCLAAGTVALAPTARAQDAPDPAGDTDREADDDFHGDIVVTASGIGRLDVLAGTSVMAGDALQQNMAGQIGEVLAKLPGVSASGFAPGASRPVLRGFSGDRVRVLNDGLGALDASSTSDDHAVSIDPLTAERIEVLRGPAVLLYGSQAIGGAVNVIGKRIPHAVPDESVHLDALASADTAADRREAGASVDMPLGGNVAFHVDGSWRQTDYVDIPGFVASAHLREELLEHAAEEEEEGHLEEAEEMREAAAMRGTLPNSWTETYDLGAGIALFSGDSNIGVSVGYYDTAYGIPGLPGIGHVHEDGEDEDAEEAGHEEHGDVSIGLNKLRVDLRGALDLGNGLFDALTTRWGYSEYTHTEFEGDEVGTVFDVKGVEGRAELVQSLRGGWSGSIGAQYLHQDFEAIGEEAFVPPNTTDQVGLFALQQLDFDPVSIELGGRYESTSIEADTLGLSRNFGTVSGAVGVSFAATPAFRVGLNGSRAERAPVAQELFADGPHIATQQFEVGDPDLGTEASWGLEAYVRGDLGPARLSASVYHNWFDGFIYLAATGEEEDGLTVSQFVQRDAKHFGLEGEVSFRLVRRAGFALTADFKGDYVRATLADGTPVPRIPPLSLLGALEAEVGDFDARAELQWFARQDRVAPLEEPTDDFALVNLSLAWKPLVGNDNLTLMVQADNLLDAEGRRHASFTKEFVPLPGRNLRLSARASF